MGGLFQTKPIRKIWSLILPRGGGNGGLFLLTYMVLLCVHDFSAKESVKLSNIKLDRTWELAQPKKTATRIVHVTRFSARGGWLSFQQIELKPKRTQTTSGGAVWARFGFQLGLRQWEVLIMSYTMHWSHISAPHCRRPSSICWEKSDPPSAENRVVLYTIQVVPWVQSLPILLT